MRENTKRKAKWLKFRKEGQARNAFLALDPNDPAIRELAESMAVRQLHPIWCDPEGYVITGHRRAVAGQQLDLEVDVCITDEALTLAEIGLIRWQENEDRSNLTDYERFLSLKDLRDHHSKMPQKEFAALVNRSESLLSRWLSPSRIIPAALEAFKAGAIGITDCYTLSKCGDDLQAQHDLLATRLTPGSTRDQLEEHRKRRRHQNVQSVKVDRLKCALPGGLNVLVSGGSVTLQEFIDALMAAVKEAKSALKDNQDAKSFAAMMANRARA
jgi:ParB-like chromosome segregation protein Spo0J